MSKRKTLREAAAEMTYDIYQSDVLDERARKDLYREAFALLKRAEELLLDAGAKHEQAAKTQRKAALLCETGGVSDAKR